MAKVIITKSLEKEINKKFKKESIKIFELLYSLTESPKKGKHLAKIGDISLREIKYKKFRFYFIVDNFKIKFLESKELKDLIIKFVRMSDKNTQQKVINEIKIMLKTLDNEGF